MSFGEKGGLTRHLGTHDALTSSVSHCTICEKDVESVEKHYEEFHAKLFCKICSKVFARARNLRDHEKNFHSLERNVFCDFCGKGFVQKRQLRRHLKLHRKFPKDLPEVLPREPSSKGPTSCPICNKVVKDLRNHNMNVHLKIRNYKCSSCQKAFFSKFVLRKHVRTAHMTAYKNHKCHIDGCTEEFPDISSLQQHLNSHDEFNNFCHLCKSFFDHLSDHYTSDHFDIKDRCEICPKLFADTESLRIHMESFHEKNENFSCDFCQATFAEKSQIRKHVKIHLVKIKQEDSREMISKDSQTTKIKLESPEIILFNVKNEIVEEENRIICYEPEITIKQEDDFDENNDFYTYSLKAIDGLDKKLPVKQESPTKRNSSLNEKDEIRCKLCKDIFHNKKHFKIHFLADHVLMHNCDLCEQEFTTQALLTRHRITHELDNHMEKTEIETGNKTANRYECKECDKSFSKRQHFQNHFLATHTDSKFSCSQCNKSFGYKRALDHHVKVIHAKQYDFVCTHCGKSFGSNHGLGLHVEAAHVGASVSTNDKTCKTCGKSFYTTGYLKKHILAKHGEKQFECDICKKMFSFEKARDRHVKSVHLNEK